VNRTIDAAVILVVLTASRVGAAEPTINELKGKIFDAHMTQQTFANGLRFCNELNGKNFYFQPRNRVLNLEEFHRSLENLAREQVYNPEKHRPWSEEDAAARWAQVQQEAITDKANCDLVASLPELEKKLRELEQNAEPDKKP
jgi:tRNA nucleotidyltransferase/poly(A) polymerase